MGSFLQEAQPEEFFLCTAKARLPSSEVRRRQEIKQVLKAQFTIWRNTEHRTWFVGNDTDCTFRHENRFLTKHRLISLLRLPEYGSTVPSDDSLQQHFEDWFEDGASCCTLHIVDFSRSENKVYCVPLKELAARPILSLSLLLDDSAERIASRLPVHPNAVGLARLVQFPQTRHSFLSDDSFFFLYPLPVQTTRKIVYRLLRRFQTGGGFFNSQAPPFFEEYDLHSLDSITRRSAFACSYPIVEFNRVSDYVDRKLSEKSAPTLQQKKTANLPLISQWRYSRRFDLVADVNATFDVSQQETRPESIQSGRGIYEFRFPDFETIDLDQKQSLVLQQEMRKSSQPSQLLVIDSLWVVLFPQRDTLFCFRNLPEYETCSHDEFSGRSENSSVCSLVIDQIEKADRAMWAYEPLYRRRIAWLQYCVQTDPFNEDLELVQGLSNLVAELDILLQVLKTQLCLLEDWQRNCPENVDKWAGKIVNRSTHRQALVNILEQTKDTQSLFFQLTSTETARRQAVLAAKMGEETKVQVQLTKKAEQRNKSILVFTIITAIFLPLSFFTSYFGMNTSDIRDMKFTQTLYWEVAAPFSFVIILLIVGVAFGSTLQRKLSSTRAAKNVDLEASEKAAKLE